MSDHAHIAEPESAIRIEERAAEWLLSRQDARNWSEADQGELDAWLAQSFAHQVAFYRLEATLDRAERLRALGPSLRFPQGVWPMMLKVAAGLAAVAVIGFAATGYFLSPPGTPYQTSVGNREILSLYDGSQIELNTDSALRIAQDGTQRKAWLDKGEAFFQIKHDPHRPFVVETGNATVRDLGTKFSLREFPDRLEVMLIEGSASVETRDGSHSAVLKPGDFAVARTDTIRVTRKSHQQLADKLGWRRGVLMFRYATLAQAAAEFNRYNHTKIVIDDPKVARLTIYGAFAANDVAAFADAAQAYFKLHIENRDGQVVLSH
jgi:transmembrane sensor